MTKRVFFAVLAALIVFSTIGAVAALVATSDDDDTPARTRLETTTR